MKPEKVRVSVGTAAVLGLLKYKLMVPPTTAYVMTYTEETCNANCSFCAQARDHQADKTLLSRVIWPDFPLAQVAEGFRAPNTRLDRVCIQVINYPSFIEDTINLASFFKRETSLPISVDICPVNTDILWKLKEAGVERISIPLDASTSELFDNIKGRQVKGPYRWETHISALNEAVKVFGEYKVGSNIIIGLGETENEVVELIQKLHDMKVMPILFAFTPLKGTRLETMQQPPIDSYRRAQVARYLIVHGLATKEEMSFNDEGGLRCFGDVDLYEALRDGEAFRTTGCPGCNRPFYNERPSGPFYNYPRKMAPNEIKRELKEMGVE